MIEMLIPDTYHLIIVLVLAAVYDLVAGEPPTPLHPVVWIGNFIGMLKKRAPVSHRRAYGFFLGLATILFASLIAFTVLVVANLVPTPVALLIEAYFLKSTFAIKRLMEASDEVYGDLVKDDLPGARKHLSMYVSRDTSSLKESQVCSSIIETCSENFVDGILSPLFYYMLLGPFGLIGAYIFKATSTLDSMVGYMDEKHRDIGYFSANFDDILNWIPARVCVFFMTAAALLTDVVAGTGKKLDHCGAIRCATSDCRATSSPNSGYPMASVAGVLHVRLEKPHTYIIGRDFPWPVKEDVKKASQVILIASILSVLLFSLLIYVSGYLIY